MAIYRQRAFPSFVGCISAQRNARGLCSRNALSFLTGFERASRSLACRKQAVVPLAGGGWVILYAEDPILKDFRGGGWPTRRSFDLERSPIRRRIARHCEIQLVGSRRQSCSLKIEDVTSRRP